MFHGIRLSAMTFQITLQNLQKRDAVMSGCFQRGPSKIILWLSVISSGRVTKVLYNAATYTNEKGEVQGVFAAARDITKLSEAQEKLRKTRRNLETRVKKRTAALQAEVAEHKRVEEALHRSEQNYRLLHDTMLQGVVYQDAEGKIISMNPAAMRILGKSPEEFT